MNTAASCKCPYCETEFPTLRILQKHEERCLVKLRRLNPAQPETAMQQWVKLVRGERAVRNGN